jgi:hypothetical protein
MLILIILSIVFFCSSPLLAGRGCDSPSGANSSDYIVVDKNAPGTKYNATLTIYYDNEASCAFSPIPANYKDMQFFLRMEGNVLKSENATSGTDLFSFGGQAVCVPYWEDYFYSEEDATALQQAALEEFFKYVVNPYIYSQNHPDDPDGCDPDSTDPASACPTFALKSFDKVVEDDPTGYPQFMMMDLVIAIQD